MALVRSICMGSGNVARRCRIIGNVKSTYGMAAAVTVQAGSAVINCLIYGNSVEAGANGGAVYLTGGSLVNCTIANNSITAAGPGGVNRTGGMVTNCIMYGNTGAGIARNYDGDISAVWYSCAPELTAGSQGNLAMNPSFINAANADYRLAIGSACLDAGTNLAGVTEDIDRRARPLAAYAGSAVRHDMGPTRRMGRVAPSKSDSAGRPSWV